MGYQDEQVNNSKPQNHESEVIFLQPIDQQYEKTAKIGQDLNNSKFFEDYEQNMIDYLNLSTDSDSNCSRKYSDKDLETSSIKVSESLKEDWKSNIRNFKQNQETKIKTSIFQKMVYMRNAVNRPRAYSNFSPVKVTSPITPDGRYFMKSESMCSLTSQFNVLNANIPDFNTYTVSTKNSNNNNFNSQVKENFFINNYK